MSKQRYKSQPFVLFLASLTVILLCSSGHADGITDAAIRSKRWIPYNKAVISYEPATRKEQGIIGNVRKVMAREVDAGIDSLSDPTICNYWVYDRAGHLLKTQNDTYIYDKAGRLLSHTASDFKFEFERDKSGKLDRKVNYARYDNEMHRDTEETFEYDSKGRLTKYIPPFHEAMFCTIFHFYYDAQDRLVKVYSYSGQMETLSEHTQLLVYRGNTVSVDGMDYTYDYKGRLTCLEIKSQEMRGSYERMYGVKHQKSTYKYNAQGLLAEQEDIDFEDKTTKTWYTYDSYSNLLKVIKKAGAEEPEVTEEYAYKYDRYGNWVEKNTVVGSEPSVRRTIIYY